MSRHIRTKIWKTHLAPTIDKQKHIIIWPRSDFQFYESSDKILWHFSSRTFTDSTNKTSGGRAPTDSTVTGSKESFTSVLPPLSLYHLYITSKKISKYVKHTYKVIFHTTQLYTSIPPISKYTFSTQCTHSWLCDDSLFWACQFKLTTFLVFKQIIIKEALNSQLD